MGDARCKPEVLGAGAPEKETSDSRPQVGLGGPGRRVPRPGVHSLGPFLTTSLASWSLHLVSCIRLGRVPATRAEERSGWYGRRIA